MRHGPPPFALLLAAHGERGGERANAGVAELAARLRETEAAEIRYGFLKGSPSIAEALRAVRAPTVLVYPLFLADGYFTRTLLPRRLAEAGDARARMVSPPLGCDPGLAPLVADNARACALQRGWESARADLLLLAHGSRTNDASRRATERLAGEIASLRVFRQLAVAFLEEPPAFADAIRALAGPIVVSGLFAGEGMHGSDDTRRLLAEAGREEVAFAGNVGGYAGLAALVRAAVSRGWNAQVNNQHEEAVT